MRRGLGPQVVEIDVAVLVGGDRSMGPGGYSKTPIEEVSPVSFDLKQEKRRASLAEVIGIDISGSMAARVGKQTKLELANEAAARSAALLGAGDYLGVEHVDTRVNWSVPLGPVKNKKAIEAAIRSVGPGGGGIFVDVTLDEAYAALKKTQVNLKHVLLFADGAPLDAEARRAFRVLGEYALDHAARVPWQAGDVLALHNRVVMHARDAFTPPRRVLVGLVLSQLKREGASFIIPGFGGEGLDMRTMVNP